MSDANRLQVGATKQIDRDETTTLLDRRATVRRYDTRPPAFNSFNNETCSCPAPGAAGPLLMCTLSKPALLVQAWGAMTATGGRCADSAVALSSMARESY